MTMPLALASATVTASDGTVYEGVTVNSRSGRLRLIRREGTVLDVPIAGVEPDGRWRWKVTGLAEASRRRTAFGEEDAPEPAPAIIYEVVRSRGCGCS